MINNHEFINRSNKFIITVIEKIDIINDITNDTKESSKKKREIKKLLY
jgi:hypothetical protein